MSDNYYKLSDMATISIRTLSRETARVLDELSSSGARVVITRDGQEVAVLTPMSPIERAFRQRLREQGVDPDDPPTPHNGLSSFPPAKPGETTPFERVMEERDSYYVDTE